MYLRNEEKHIYGDIQLLKNRIFIVFSRLNIKCSKNAMSELLKKFLNLRKDIFFLLLLRFLFYFLCQFLGDNMSLVKFSFFFFFAMSLFLFWFSRFFIFSYISIFCHCLIFNLQNSTLSFVAQYCI